MFSPLGNTKCILVPAGIAASLELALTVGPIPETYIAVNTLIAVVMSHQVRPLDAQQDVS